MKRKIIIILIILAVVGVSTSVLAVSVNNSQIQQHKNAQYLQEFNDFQLKTNFTNRDEVFAEIKRLGNTYKNAIGAHLNDETGKKIVIKFQTMTNQLKEELSRFPTQSPTLEEQIAKEIASWNDEVAYNNAREYPSDHANAEYALNEAEGIYDLYKQGEISAQEALARIQKVKVTDRQNGINN